MDNQASNQSTLVADLRLHADSVDMRGWRSSAAMLRSAADEIEQLTQRQRLYDEVAQISHRYRSEAERLRAALKTVHKMAGGHAIECQCERCQIFEFLEPIVGNSAPDSSGETGAPQK